jgi:hypothetical protein
MSKTTQYSASEELAILQEPEIGQATHADVTKNMMLTKELYQNGYNPKNS